MRAHVLILCIALAARCARSDDDEEAPPQDSSRPAALPPAGSGEETAQYPPTLLTPAGGSFEEGDLQIVAPAGAVDQALALTLESLAGGGADLQFDEAAGRLEVGDAYRLGPEGTTFNQPLWVTLSYAAYEAPLGALAARLVIFRTSGAVVEALPSAVDTDSATVSAATDHFSIFGLGIPTDALSCPDLPFLELACQAGADWACGLANWVGANRDCMPPPFCGNGVMEAGEVCDEGDLCGLPLGCACDCSGLTAAQCGNDILEEGETCDGLPQACNEPATGYRGSQPCSADCQGHGACLPEERCGDGTINGPEVCDDGPSCGLPLGCACACAGLTPPVCGNGVAEAGEVCDDGPSCGLPLGCACDCAGLTPPVCGNSVAEAGEVCDSGPSCGLPALCACDCSRVLPPNPFCGNNVLDPGEACDFGLNCGQPLFCACDCSGLTPPVCGNNVVEAGEACDPGGSGSSGCCVNCLLSPSGSVCRSSQGVCDVAEICNGLSPACPPDVKKAAGNPCGGGGPCESSPSCDGVSNTCPPVINSPDGLTCLALPPLIPGCISNACACYSGVCRVSFALDILPIFTDSAVNPNACINCHIGGATQGLDLDSYANAMLGTSANGPVILPGNPDGSILYRKVNCWGQPAGYCLNDNPMPNGGPALTSEQIQYIYDWIAQGAQDN